MPGVRVLGAGGSEVHIKHGHCHCHNKVETIAKTGSGYTL